MRRLKTVRRPPIYPKTPGHLPCSSLTHPLPLSSRRLSVSFGGFGLREHLNKSGTTAILCWNRAWLRRGLEHSSNLFRGFLGGKLVASLIASEEVGNKFQERYGGREGLISGKHKQARLTLVTVTPALGRSSVYNRLRLMPNADSETDKPVVELRKLGATTGYGHFQITDDLFSQLRRVLQEDGHKYADGNQFGDGPNWRIRVARIGLQSLGLNPDEILKHGIRREVYSMPIANNARAFLAGRDEEPIFDWKTVDEISTLARNRWLVPRGERRPSYRQFRREHLGEVLTLATMET